MATHQYFAVNTISQADDEVTVERLNDSTRQAFLSFIEEQRGAVFTQAEELDAADVELEALDEAYRKVSLRRYRRILLAVDRRTHAIVGAAIVHRGPLGLNFSFLENHCDLVIQSGCGDAVARSAVHALLAEAAAYYEDFEPGMIPVICNRRCGAILTQAGAQFIREYAQSCWLPQAYVAYYRHVEKFYARVMEFEKRHRARDAKQAEPQEA